MTPACRTRLRWRARLQSRWRTPSWLKTSRWQELALLIPSCESSSDPFCSCCICCSIALIRVEDVRNRVAHRGLHLFIGRRGGSLTLAAPAPEALSALGVAKQATPNRGNSVPAVAAGPQRPQLRDAVGLVGRHPAAPPSAGAAAEPARDLAARHRIRRLDPQDARVRRGDDAFGQPGAL